MVIFGVSDLVLFCSVLLAHEDQWPCMEDKEKFCKGLTLGYSQCLKDRMKDLSNGCRSYFLADEVVHHKNWEKKREDCRDDGKRICPDVDFDEQRHAVTCLLMHEEKLSKKCKGSLQKMKPKG